MNLAVKVKVTQDDIDKGCRGSAGNCPVARALTRALIDLGVVFSWAGVGCSLATVTHERKPTFQGNLPKYIEEWIRVFDYGGPEGVAPINFEVELEAIP